MELFWGVLMMLASGSFGAPLTSPNITLHCEESIGLAERAEVAPTPPAALNVGVSKEGEENMLDIRWAIHLDSSAKYITGVDIDTSQTSIKCKYSPSLAEAIRRALIPAEQQQIWFHHRTPVFPHEYYHVQVANLPLPPPENGDAYLDVVVDAPISPAGKNKTKDVTSPPPTTPGTGQNPKTVITDTVWLIWLIIGLVLLLSGFIAFKLIRASLVMGQRQAAAGPKVPVLVVYPPEGAAFQVAVVALAEFLQQHGGCSVSIDMWQQGSVAKLGPMRWLLGQVQTAHRVLIVAPQPCSQSPAQTLLPSQVSHPPAAAQDLYPLALNLVASRAKKGSELAKFWVVHFGEGVSLTSELQACHTFSLMKDLTYMCRRLHGLKPDMNMRVAHLLMRSSDWYNTSCTEKLQEAIQTLHE